MTIKTLRFKKKTFVKILRVIFEEVDVEREKMQNIGYSHENS